MGCGFTKVRELGGGGGESSMLVSSILCSSPWLSIQLAVDASSALVRLHSKDTPVLNTHFGNLQQ